MCVKMYSFALLFCGGGGAGVQTSERISKKLVQIPDQTLVMLDSLPFLPVQLS